MSYKVSVIVPVYNAEKYLHMCIKSLLNQTIESLQIILVNDGSTDSSGAIIDKYANENANIVSLHKENGGSSTARNLGIKKATGEYIAFLDSDDWVDDIAYETLYGIATENNKPDIIMYRSHGEKNNYFIPENGYYDRAGIESKILPNLMPYFDDNKPRYLRFSNCMKFHKRSFLVESGVFYHDNILIMEDALFTFDCLDRAQSFYYTDKELYYVTVNPTSVSRSPYSKNKAQSMLLISEYIREFKNRDTGYDYGNSIYSAMLYFFEEGISNALKAPKLSKCFSDIRRILNSEICKWYIKQDKPIVSGWYGKIQKNITECNAIKLLYRVKYRSKLKGTLHKIKNCFRRK